MSKDIITTPTLPDSVRSTLGDWARGPPTPTLNSQWCNLPPAHILNWLYDTATLPQEDPNAPPPKSPLTQYPNVFPTVVRAEGYLSVVLVRNKPKLSITGFKRRGVPWDWDMAHKVVSHAMEMWSKTNYAPYPRSEIIPPAPVAQKLKVLSRRLFKTGRADLNTRGSTPPPPPIAASRRCPNLPVLSSPKEWPPLRSPAVQRATSAHNWYIHSDRSC